MIVDCIADLHGNYPKLDGGDLLIIAGDFCEDDWSSSILEFLSWFQWQQYKKKVFIAGNHDNWLKEININKFKEWGFTYLCDSGTEFEYYEEKFPKEDEGFLPGGNRKLKIWGSPWTLTFDGMNPHCKAFTKDSEKDLQSYVEMIPDDVDILVTHGPAHHVLDKTIDGREVGHGHLYGYLKYAIRPKLHVFGHIHESYGQIEYFTGCISVNASHVNAHYKPVNPPIRVIL